MLTNTTVGRKIYAFIISDRDGGCGAIGVGGGPNGVVDTEVAQAGLDALK